MPLKKEAPDTRVESAARFTDIWGARARRPAVSGAPPGAWKVLSVGTQKNPSTFKSIPFLGGSAKRPPLPFPIQHRERPKTSVRLEHGWTANIPHSDSEPTANFAGGEALACSGEDAWPSARCNAR